MKARKHVVGNLAPLAVIVAGSAIFAGCGTNNSGVGTPTTGSPVGSSPASVGSTSTSATSVVGVTPPVDPSKGAACAFPTAVNGRSPEELAWRIFVALNCAPAAPNPSGQSRVWETWTEQQNLVPGATGTQKRQPHASRLGLTKKGSAAPVTTPDGVQCSPMATTPAPYAPSNLTKSACFAEEVFANPSEVSYINRPAPQALFTLTGQANAGTIDFPSDSIEIKADWVAASSFTNATFKCDGSTDADVYTESFGGTCYALVGIHVSSKLFPNWLWATFEPQYPITNPNRCDKTLYSQCKDPWGSDPPIVEKNGTSKLTAPLAQLMRDALLPKAFYNYRLVGVQWDYDTNKHLGNSFVEFNAGVPPQQASCITCHSFAALSTTAPYAPVKGAFGGLPPDVGVVAGMPTTPAPAGAPYFTQDRSYLLDFMGPTGQTPVK